MWICSEEQSVSAPTSWLARFSPFWPILLLLRTLGCDAVACNLAFSLLAYLLRGSEIDLLTCLCGPRRPGPFGHPLALPERPLSLCTLPVAPTGSPPKMLAFESPQTNSSQVLWSLLFFGFGSSGVMNLMSPPFGCFAWGFSDILGANVFSIYSI